VGGERHPEPDRDEIRLRHAGVLRLAAEKAGWDQPLPNGGFRGVAVAESFKTFVAQIAEVSLDESGRPKVERVVCAVDCGVAVNPDVIRAQMEGGIGFGAVMKSQLTIEGGAAQEGNFDGYDVLRLNERPHVEIHIVPSPDGRRVSESPACRPSALPWPTRSMQLHASGCEFCPSRGRRGPDTKQCVRLPMSGMVLP
jgi:CO/xanthine dehydrogenase Mo-binding subunit